MGWVAIRAKIKDKLDALVTGGTLGSVWNGEQYKPNMDIPAYPAAEIVRLQSEPAYWTNKEDMQAYVFSINLYMPLTEDNWDEVEIAMDPIVDAVTQAFLDDASLGGAADGRIQPIAMAAVQHTWNGKVHRRDMITLKCNKITAMDD